MKLQTGDTGDTWQLIRSRRLSEHNGVRKLTCFRPASDSRAENFLPAVRRFCPVRAVSENCFLYRYSFTAKTISFRLIPEYIES